MRDTSHDSDRHGIMDKFFSTLHILSVVIFMMDKHKSLQKYGWSYCHGSKTPKEEANEYI